MRTPLLARNGFVPFQVMMAVPTVDRLILDVLSAVVALSHRLPAVLNLHQAVMLRQGPKGTTGGGVCRQECQQGDGIAPCHEKRAA
jgi:hypothetical protein